MELLLVFIYTKMALELILVYTKTALVLVFVYTKTTEAPPKHAKREFIIFAEHFDFFLPAILHPKWPY
jgi:hypothetical protein